MRPSAALHRYRAELAALLGRHHLVNGRVFGSVVRGEDTDGSDLDLLVDPLPDVTTLFDIMTLKADAERLLGVPVDVRTAEDIHERFRSRVISEARSL